MGGTGNSALPFPPSSLLAYSPDLGLGQGRSAVHGPGECSGQQLEQGVGGPLSWGKESAKVLSPQLQKGGGGRGPCKATLQEPRDRGQAWGQP